MKNTASTVVGPITVPIQVAMVLARLANKIDTEAHRRLDSQDCQLMIRMETEADQGYFSEEWGGLPTRVHCTICVPPKKKSGEYVPLGISCARLFIGDRGARCTFFAHPEVEGCVDDLLDLLAGHLVEYAIRGAQAVNYLKEVK